MIEVKDLTFGEAYTTEDMHFTGGIRGRATKQGWALFPVSEHADSDVLIFKNTKAYFEFATQECGLHYIGLCIHYFNDKSLPLEVWLPGGNGPKNGLNAADSWGAIAHQAHMAGDIEYAGCATYISVCLKVAGLRLRDVSNKYHIQLNAAQAEGYKTGTWFSNLALLDLYADFHSLVSELSSARDHLARLAAIHVGAPHQIDSLARVETWVKKTVNKDFATQPLIALLLSASGTKSEPNWLRKLGDIRNEMLHRIPMGANKSVSGLTLQEVNTSQGIIKTIRLAEPSSKIEIAKQCIDPLVELTYLSKNLEELCKIALKHARYPADPPLFTSNLHE